MASRLILITGNSRGLGLALSQELVRLGHRVLGAQRPEVHVEQPSSVSAWAESVLAEHGPPDFLVNNAGVVNDRAPLWEVREEDFSATVDINLKGPFYVIKAFLPAMLARGSGVVVNISSGWGRTTAPQVAPYCATKWAIEGMTRALAQELPAGLAAVTLDPGTIDTDLLRRGLGPAAASYFPKPESWAKVAAPLVLSLGPQHNGQALTVPQVAR